MKYIFQCPKQVGFAIFDGEIKVNHSSFPDSYFKLLY